MPSSHQYPVSHSFYLAAIENRLLKWRGRLTSMMMFRQTRDSISLWYFVKYKYLVYSIDKIESNRISIDLNLAALQPDLDPDFVATTNINESLNCLPNNCLAIPRIWLHCFFFVSNYFGFDSFQLSASRFAFGYIVD